MAHPTPPLPDLPPPHSPSSPSSTPPSPSSPSSPHPLQPPLHVSDAVLRRRSADIGGLHRALRGGGQGQGWLGGTSSDPNIETPYAELLAFMYRETLQLVETNAAHNDPPELSSQDRIRLLKGLDQWYFEPLRMPEHEVLASVLFIFEVLFRIEGMSDAIKIDMDMIPRFIVHIRQMYRWQNHYHNFEHAVDVLQAIHCYLRDAGMVPPVSLLLNDANAPDGKGMWSSTRDPDSGPLVTSLTPHEIFALYLAAIGHDVAHPGFNNPFMRNAGAPIAQVYDNQSALEQMHSYLLLRTLRHHGLGVLLDDPHTGYLFRKILGSSVLATDMAVHDDFMKTCRMILEGATDGIVAWQSTRCSRQAFVCQLLLKNADISNPCRPFPVSKQWASALQQEWACQYKFEHALNITHSVKYSDEPLSEAHSQVFFSKFIAKPLIYLTTLAVPEMKHISYRCAENLREWERILEGLQDGASEGSATTPASASTSSGSASRPPQQQQQETLPLQPVQSPASLSSPSNPVSPRIMNPSTNDYSTAFRLTLPPSSRSTTVSTPGSIRRQPSGTSMGSLSLSPSLSRATTTAAATTNHVTRNGSSGGGGIVNPQALTTRTCSNSSNSSSVSDISSPVAIVNHHQHHNNYHHRSLQRPLVQSRAELHSSDVDSELGLVVNGGGEGCGLDEDDDGFRSDLSVLGSSTSTTKSPPPPRMDMDSSAVDGHHDQHHQHDRSFQTVMLAGLRRQRSSHSNRISWCPGEPVPMMEGAGMGMGMGGIMTVGDAIEKWRGRLPGPTTGGGGRCVSGGDGLEDGGGGGGPSVVASARAVALESEDGSEKEEDESIPAGLVSAAPESEPAEHLKGKVQMQTHPCTPPQQMGSLQSVDDDELEGSPTPKGKNSSKKIKGKPTTKGRSQQGKTGEEVDEMREERRPKTEEERERMTRELIEEFEEEQRRKVKEREREKERARSRSKAAAKRRRKGR